jgi:N-acetylmuramoyl-L-alanine amidase
VRDIAARYGLRFIRTKEGRLARLADAAGVRLEFEDRNRDFHLDGTRVFLGAPVVSDRGSLWVSKLDVIKLVAPLFRPADHAHQLPATPRVIVLDPGHGGSDPGKENQLVGIQEKNATLDVALRLEKILSAQGYQIVLTRSDDTRLASDQATDLQRRAEVAQKARADLFLSIHFNAVERGALRVTGTETYTMTPQFMFSTADEKKDEMTNTAFPGNKSDYASLFFGYHLHRALLAALQTSDRGFKRARFVVLRFVECPAVLIESAYLSNDAEARRIASPDYRQRIAEGIAAGVQAYVNALGALRASPTVPAPTTPKP